MTSNNFRALLKKLGHTQRDFARLIGINERTVSVYVAKGIYNVPVSILATLLAQKKITPDDILKTGRAPYLSPADEEEFYRRVNKAPVAIAPSSRHPVGAEEDHPRRLQQHRKEVIDPETDWKRSLPSAEHRGHIRRFTGSDLTDEQDVALRGYIFWKRSNFALMIAAEAAVKRRTSRRSK